MSNVIWTPQPKQMEFMSRGEDEVLFGGAAGGGKSDGLVVEGLRQVWHPRYKGIIFRRTYPQLKELIDKSRIYYKSAFPKAEFNSTSHTWKFPSGAKIEFGSMQYEKDRENYQGQEYQYIAFDELTHFTYPQYSYMRSRNRTSEPDLECYMRSTANPGGVGHGWVKELFIDPAEPMETIWKKFQIVDPKGNKIKLRRSLVFVPSLVWDNPALLENDPQYLASLAALSDKDQAALLYGDWNSFSGQVFRIINKPGRGHKNTHVIEPFEIPAHWQRWCSMDWGYRKPYSIHWYAVDEQQRLYCIRELYGCNGEPNMGVQQEPMEVAKLMREIEESDPNLKGQKILRVGDPAIWASQGAESIGTLFEKNRIYFEKAVNDRLNGKMQVHYRLSFDGQGMPMLFFFKTCRHMLRTLPTLVYDENRVEDVDTDCEDHAYDELRYMCMRYVISKPKADPEKPKLKPYDPLDPLDNYYGKTAVDRYDFYRQY